MHDTRPLIVTAQLPDDIFAWADALRREHFPPERNHLAAHVTLFHALAPSLHDEVRSLLARLAAEHAPPGARVTGLMNLGRGTAIALESAGMLTLRARIAEHFHGALTAQDQHTPRLHVTVQNKVAPGVAKALQQALLPVVSPRAFAFAGLGLHLYCNPHWEPVATWRFRGKQVVDHAPARP